MNPLIKLTYADGSHVLLGTSSILKVTEADLINRKDIGSRVTCNSVDGVVNHLVTEKPDMVSNLVHGALAQVIYDGRTISDG